MLYTVSGLTQVYDRRTVLDIPQMDIDEGGIYALLGPNGAGKTTLLDILAFLSRPTTGTIHFRSRKVVFTEPALRSLRQEVVMVDQSPILFTTSVYQNVAFGLKVRHMPRRRQAAVISEALELVGMADFSRAMGHRLSGGETQRVALARALAVSPRVLLCDEPTASVDVENQAAVTAILKRINRETGITILFTTHDRFQAAALGREMLYLDRGRLVSAGVENVFSAALVRDPAGHTECRLSESLRMTVPDAPAHAAGPRRRVLIDPERIVLAGGGPHPRGNRFEGRVVQISEEWDRIRLVVDIGMRLHLIMETADYRSTGPRVGDRTVLIIPPEAVRVLPA